MSTMEPVETTAANQMAVVPVVAEAKAEVVPNPVKQVALPTMVVRTDGLVHDISLNASL